MEYTVIGRYDVKKSMQFMDNHHNIPVKFSEALFTPNTQICERILQLELLNILSDASEPCSPPESLSDHVDSQYMSGHCAYDK